MAAPAGLLQSPAALLGSLRWPSPECMCLSNFHGPLQESPNISCASTRAAFRIERVTEGLSFPEYMQSMINVRWDSQH